VFRPLRVGHFPPDAQPGIRVACRVRVLQMTAADVSAYPFLADAAGLRVALSAELRDRRAGPFSFAQIRAAVKSVDGINRYNGRLGAVISVASHSIRVGKIARAILPAAEPYGLAHDLHEAWIGDETTPAEKDMAAWLGLPEYRPARAAQKAFLDGLIFPALGLDWPMPPPIADAVREADFLAFVAEFRELGPETPRDPRLTPDVMERANKLYPHPIRSIPLYASEDRFWRALCANCPALPQNHAA